MKPVTQRPFFQRVLFSFFKRFHRDAKLVARISPLEASGLLQADRAVLVDVREEEELREEGTAEPALWLATSEIESDSSRAREFVRKLPRSKLIVVYCAAGVRSGRFAKHLAEQGFQAANLGGFDDWTGAGLPTRPFP